MQKVFTYCDICEKEISKEEQEAVENNIYEVTELEIIYSKKEGEFNSYELTDICSNCNQKVLALFSNNIIKKITG